VECVRGLRDVVAVTPILFLPGAGGSAAFWRPVGERLGLDRPMHLFAWPGLGHEPPDPAVRGVDDLVRIVLDRMDGPCDLVAQSMGGLVALKAALAAPDRIRRLVLTGTSGGVPVEDLGGADWREGYRRQFPRAVGWITEIREDLSARLHSVRAPVLLLWGEVDAISPVSVGERLAALLPDARLQVVPGGDHDFPMTHSAGIAPLIARHLS
jgi:pimeloyl-ACP methyl ester carboxylesterase